MTLAPKNPRARKVRMNAVAFSIMLRVLQRKEGATYEDVVEETGLAEATVRDYISAMRRSSSLAGEPKSVFIIGWDRDVAGRVTVPRFRLRHKEQQYDVKKPDKMTGAERAKRYREKRDKTALARELHIAITGVGHEGRPGN